MMGETWKIIPNWERYEVSSLGRIRRIKSGLVLRPSPNPRGYLLVSLYRGRGQGKFTMPIAKAVASAFLGKRPDGLTINHLDGVKTNNTPDNLEYCTRDENNKHAARLGLRPKGDKNGANTKPERRARGSRQGSSKLTEQDVPLVRQLHAEGVFHKDIAAHFGVARSTIDRVIRGEIWTHVAA